MNIQISIFHELESGIELKLEVSADFEFKQNSSYSDPEEPEKFEISSIQATNASGIAGEYGFQDITEDYLLTQHADEINEALVVENY